MSLPLLSLAIAKPFRGDGSIDYAQFVTLIERYLQAGIESFVVSSGTGMHVYLSRDESAALIETAVQTIVGRASIIAQTSALPVAEVISRSQQARDLGVDTLMILPPFFEGPSEDQGMFDFYANVCELGLPVIGYNVPEQVGFEITAQLFERLGQLPNYCSIKDSSGDLVAQQRLINTGGPVINGCDPMALAALRSGAAGLIWGGANFAPRTCVALARAAKAGLWDKAQIIWERMSAAMHHISGSDYVASVYAAAQMTGFDFGYPRVPLRALSQEKQRALRVAMQPLLASPPGAI